MGRNVNAAILLILTLACGAGAAELGALCVTAAALKGAAAAEEQQIKPFYVGTCSRKDPSELEFIAIPGGRLLLGPAGGDDPGQEVNLRGFEMSRTPVTVAQYAECVAAGRCTRPETGDKRVDRCNWGVLGREDHPINCVTWEQAGDFARFKEARLPSEAEWQHAAGGGGRGLKFPWGDAEPGCDRAVMSGCHEYGRTMPVCSAPLGNSVHGLCDMSGNVRQWVQDTFRGSFAGQPADGRAFEGPGERRVLRGASFLDDDAAAFSADARLGVPPGLRRGNIGFRIAR